MSAPVVDRRPVARWPYWITPSVHLVLALTGPLYYLLAVAPYGWSLEGSPDANIGAGLAIFWTILFGLPWSAPAYSVNDIDRLGGNVTELLFTSLALLNVLLHSGVAYWLYRRAVRRASRPRWSPVRTEGP